MPGKASKENGKKGGRPKGAKSASTLEKEKVLAEVRQRIMSKAERLINAQMSLAEGQSYLYVIRTERDSKGKRTKSKPEIVTDPEVIKDFIDGEYGEGEDLNDEESYYYITTKEANNMALDSMLNRAFGKPIESVEMSGKDGGAIQITWEK